MENTKGSGENPDGVQWIVYWHKGMNSGLWVYSDEETAMSVAEDLKTQEDMYEVAVIKASACVAIKGKVADKAEF